MDNDPIVIVAAKRTPIGNMLGSLSTLPASDLGAIANKAVIEQAGIQASDIEEVITGCVLQAGQGQAPGRQAAIKAGIPNFAGATTINKMCGSGMKAVMLAHDLIKAGSAQIALANGMESMSNAPYLLGKARAGYRLGHGELKDSMFLDGLEDAYDKGQLMGCFAENTASHFGFTRENQDDFAIESLNRSLKAQQNGSFEREIVPVTLQLKKQTVEVTQDEGPDEAKIAKIPKLRPAFEKDGTVTAANSSSISDGAASILLMPLSVAQKRGLTPLAKIVAHASHAQAPEWFTTAPVDAIKKVLEKANWQQIDVELYEINEAFAVVTLAAIKQLGLPSDIVNVNGGACALGHPIGASGTRILVTLLHALEKHGLKRGIGALCIGGGEATAMAIERL
jgi:acetyl-CoA C-acetyltransferase